MTEDLLSQAQHWLRSHQSQMEKELITLCELNSWSDHEAGLHATARHLESLMQDLHRPCERQELPNRTWTDDDGKPCEQATGPWLAWRSEPQPGSPRVLLGIHYDTVYPPESSPHNCTRFGNECLRGPGVIDAKGGIIIMRWTLLAAIHFRCLERLQWSMVLNPDEEVGSFSSLDAWKREAANHDFGMLYEPAMADGSLVSERKGSGNFLFLIEGRAAHAGRNFSLGRNAILHASALACDLHQLNQAMPGVTINVGRIVGGGPLNVVPERCALRFNIRVENASQLAWVESQLDLLTSRYHRPEEGFACHLQGALTSPPKTVDDNLRIWMQRVESAASRVGQSVKWKASGGASDGNKLAAFGLPNIDTFGPEGDELHSPKEWIRLGSLPEKAILSLATLLEIQNLS